MKSATKPGIRSGNSSFPSSCLDVDCAILVLNIFGEGCNTDVAVDFSELGVWPVATSGCRFARAACCGLWLFGSWVDDREVMDLSGPEGSFVKLADRSPNCQVVGQCVRAYVRGYVCVRAFVRQCARVSVCACVCARGVCVRCLLYTSPSPRDTI